VAVIKCGAVRDAGLGVDADEPPERHALIRAWPWFDNDRQLEKAQQKEKALRLAAASKVILFSA